MPNADQLIPGRSAHVCQECSVPRPIVDRSALLTKTAHRIWPVSVISVLILVSVLVVSTLSAMLKIIVLFAPASLDMTAIRFQVAVPFKVSRFLNQYFPAFCTLLCYMFNSFFIALP